MKRRLRLTRWTLAIASIALLGAALAACNGDGDTGPASGNEGDDALGSATERLSGALDTLERELPVVIEQEGAQRNPELGAALRSVGVACEDAESLGDSEEARALRRACDRIIHGGVVRTLVTGNTLFLFDEIDSAREILADFQ